MQPEVVTFGETMVLFEPIQKAPLEFVHQFEKHIGGAESNVSIGLSRLGHSVGWFSKLGNDPFGRYVNNFIRGEGVDVSQCVFTDDANTGLLFKEKKAVEKVNVFYYRNGSAASLLTPEEINEEYIANARILHITGITAALSNTCESSIFRAIEIAKKNNVRVVLDPNIRLKLWTKEKAKKVLGRIVDQVDVILPGLDEGKLMTGETTPEGIARELNKSGGKRVIVKLGSDGAYYHSDSESMYATGFKVKQVVDPVGAGDGFAAGIISGMLHEESVEEILNRANAMGAIAVGFHGDVEGLPREEELLQFIKQDTDETDVNR